MASVSHNLSSIEVTNLDHLGIVAGLIDEIGNEGVPERSRRTKDKTLKATLDNE